MERLGLIDGLGSKSNSIFWLRHIEYLEKQIDIREEYNLQFDFAHNYYAWLIVTIEYLFYEVRRKSVMLNDNPELFDSPYRDLVKSCEKYLPDDLYQHIRLFEAMRHIIIHKGFPSTHSIPMSRIQNKSDKEIFSNALSIMRNPDSYSQIKSMKDRILDKILSYDGKSANK